jgi:hypothetical protein
MNCWQNILEKWIRNPEVAWFLIGVLELHKVSCKKRSALVCSLGEKNGTKIHLWRRKTTHPQPKLALGKLLGAVMGFLREPCWYQRSLYHG